VQVVLRKEKVWMSRQPKARQAKSKSRMDAFEELTAKARSGPARDVVIDFGDISMARQGKKVLVMKVDPGASS
jgi:ABC transport system ATP-binding/permease protein